MPRLELYQKWIPIIKGLMFLFISIAAYIHVMSLIFTFMDANELRNKQKTIKALKMKDDVDDITKEEIKELQKKVYALEGQIAFIQGWISAQHNKKP